MRKTGFTLIEVVVVVLIVGVLAAIGLPKLFGQIAKAKASEVSVAASTYTRLQDAYFVEKNLVGSWKGIGYIAPGNGLTTNFKYDVGCIADSSSIESLGKGVIGWKASNLSKLNDCFAFSNWAVAVKPESQTNINYQYRLSYEGCVPLTTNWVVAAISSECSSGNSSNEKEPSTPPTESSPPEDSAPSSSASETPPEESTPSSAAPAINCEELKNKHSDANGNKKGWVHIDACGFSVPPGVAKELGIEKNKDN